LTSQINTIIAFLRQAMVALKDKENMMRSFSFLHTAAHKEATKLTCVNERKSFCIFTYISFERDNNKYFNCYVLPSVSY
jgi:hypothetical protein